MPTFEIPDGPTSIDIARPSDPKSTAPAQGSAVFNVTNKASEGRDGRLSVQVAGSSKAEWFSIDGDRERPFGAGETQTATIKISIPADVAAGDYPFRLRAVAVNDPDNDHAEGPVTTAKLAGVGGKSGGVPWWIWLIIGIVVLAALGAGGYFLLKGKDDGGGNEVEEATNNVVVAEAPKVPNFVDQSVDSIAADAGGFQIIKNETPNTGRKPRTVYEQDPKPDAKLAQGGRVILSYEPGVLVPQLPGGATFTSAPNVLRAAGLEPGNFTCDPSSGSAGAQVGAVTNFSPAPGSRVAAPSKVDMSAIQSGPCIRFILTADVFQKLKVENNPRATRLHRFKAPGE